VDAWGHGDGNEVQDAMHVIIFFLFLRGGCAVKTKCREVVELHVFMEMYVP